MRRILLCPILAILIANAAHASILANGGFETGDFTSWTQSGWFIDTTNPNSNVYDAATGCGGASCTTVGDPDAVYLFQDFATTPGTSYALSFFYDSGQDATLGSELLVLWGDSSAPILSTVVDFLNVDTAGAYAQYIGLVTASSSTSELEFFGRQDLDFYYLDDVSLSPIGSNVPEPGSLTLLAGGLLALTLLQPASKKRFLFSRIWMTACLTVRIGLLT